MLGKISTNLLLPAVILRKFDDEILTFAPKH